MTSAINHTDRFPPEPDHRPRLRILVVDDEPDVCDLLAAALQATSSCLVRAAHNALDALSAIGAEDTPFDGIFLDIQMPGTTGVELCAIIRTTPGYEDVPVIMLTAMTDRRYMHGAYAAGADDYIAKPFEIEEIRAKLGKERWSRRRRNHLKAGRAALGSSGREGGREVISALEDAVLLPAIRRCIRRDAFQNYLLQARGRLGAALTVRAVKLAAIHDIFSRVSTTEYQALMDAVARTLSEETEPSHDVITHLGNGIFLTATEGQSALCRDGLQSRLQAAGVDTRLRAHDLSLRVIIGETVVVGQGSDADILFAISRAIQGVERAEEDLSGWATFREWLSFRKSTGREQARLDQSAYEQILNDFLSEGDLGWSRARPGRT